jgi:hypothetical protein
MTRALHLGIFEHSVEKGFFRSDLQETGMPAVDFSGSGLYSESIALILWM